MDTWPLREKPKKKRAIQVKGGRDKHSSDWFHLINPPTCLNAISSNSVLAARLSEKRRDECLLAVGGGE